MNDTPSPTKSIDIDGRRIAYRQRPGRSPTLLFLPGYASDMEGSKATALDAFAAEHGLAMLRFDYSGTGSSPGAFADGTLDRWLDEATVVLDRLVDGPALLVGSSMGGWIALHLALRRPERVRGLVGVAAAPDFTDWGFDETLRAALREHGHLADPTDRSPDATVMTRGFWDSGQRLLLLADEIAVTCPVRLLHGDADTEVPLKVALRLLDRLRSADVQLTVIKGGRHRLSEPHELDALRRTVAQLVEQTS